MSIAYSCRHDLHFRQLLKAFLLSISDNTQAHFYLCDNEVEGEES